MIITVNKIGDGSYSNPYRPDTTFTTWMITEETDTTFTIEVPDDEV